jgi:integrase
VSDLRQRSHEYLAMRRALGYKLVGEGLLLADFVAFVETAGRGLITTELAVAWATKTKSASQPYLARRLRVARSFARHLRTLEPGTEVPPADLFPAGKYRPTPYIYSDDDIAALMSAAGELSPGLRAATFETLIGLLAATGMRIGEAMALDRDDIDWHNGLLIVRTSKYGKSREVLLHPSTIEALDAYRRQRDRLSPQPSASSFFVSTRGTRLLHTAIYPTFRELLRRTGLDRASPSCRPRVHGLRHTFAVNTLLEWSRDGGDVAVRMPLLSTYLGHTCPAATYWYLSAVPELLGLAAARLEEDSGQRS